MIASSLALVLGASVAVAQVNMFAGNAENPTNPATITGEQLKWVTEGNDFFKPQFTPSGGSGAVGIQNLNFTFADVQGITGTSNTTDRSYAATIGAKDNNHFKIVGNKGLQIGTGATANGVTTYGTMKVDFGNIDNARSFTLDLSNVTGNTAFRGNLEILAGVGSGDRSFTGIFGKNVEGDITLGANAEGGENGDASSADHQNSLTFKDGANLMGNLTLITGNSNIIFENGGKISGNVEVTYMFNPSPVTAIIFNKKGEIGGFVKAFGDSRKLSIDFKEGGEIKGGIISTDNFNQDDGLVITSGGELKTKSILVQGNSKLSIGNTQSYVKTLSITNGLENKGGSTAKFYLGDDTGTTESTIGVNDAKFSLYADSSTANVNLKNTTLKLSGGIENKGGGDSSITITGQNSNLQILNGSINNASSGGNKGNHTVKIDVKSLTLGNGSILNQTTINAKNTQTITAQTLQVDGGGIGIYAGTETSITLNGVNNTTSQSSIGKLKDDKGQDIDYSIDNNSATFTLDVKESTLTLTGGIRTNGGGAATSTILLADSILDVKGDVGDIQRADNQAINFNLNSSSLIIGGNTSDFTSLVAAGDSNALTIKRAKNILNKSKNRITTLTLGAQATRDASGQAIPAKNGILTLSTANALSIANLAIVHENGSLNITSDSAGAITIGTATLDGKTLTIDNASNQALTITTLTTNSGTNILNFNKGEATITNQITAGNGVTNNINLSNGVTLTSAIKTEGNGTNTITLTGTNSTTSATINGEISGTGNRITLDSKATSGDKTNLTLSGANDKTITSLTALSNDASSMNTLTIAENAKGANTIQSLVLGDDTKAGFLTIANNAKDENGSKVLTIDTFESKFKESKLTISAGEVAITNALTGENNNIALGANTALTLNGKNNNFALEVSGTSSLKFGDNAVSNTISTLTLGTTTNGTLNLSSANALTIDNLNVANKVGTLNIASDSKGVSITTATLKGGKTLKLNDDRKDATLTISTLKTQGIDNQIYFHKDLRITTLSETTGTIKDDNKDNTSLTFVNQLTKNIDAQDPNKVTYTAGLLTINGSNNTEGNNQTKNPQLSGTYKMAIMGDKAIKPEEIVYDPKGTNNVKVATIKKYDGATSGGTQEELRGQGVIDLGDKTALTLTRDLTLQTFGYYVAETKADGTIDATAANNTYITYFLNGHGEAKLDIKQNILSNLALSATELYLANFNSLNRRMGELRDNKHAQGVWGRVFNGMQSNDANLKSSTLYTTVQAGYDYGFGLGEGVTNYLGFALSYGHSQSGFKNKAIFENNFASIDSLKSDLVEFALYNSYVQDSGWYNDTVAKFSYLLNQVRYSSQSFMETSSHQGDINTYAFTLSNEFGYRFKLGASDEWYIDPQAEIGFGYFEGQDFKFKGDNSSLTKLGTMDSLLTLRSRFGASFGYDFKNFTSKESGLSAKLYLGVFGEVDYFNGGDVKFGSESAQWAINTDTRAVLNVGTNLEIKESTRLYLDVESSFGGKITTDYKINAGVRYSFGEKIQFLDVKNQENKEEAPLKLQEEEKKNAQEQTEKDVKEEAKAGGKEEAKMQEQAPRGEQVEAEKTDTKKADTKKADVKTEKKTTKKQSAKKT